MLQSFKRCSLMQEEAKNLLKSLNQEREDAMPLSECMLSGSTEVCWWGEGFLLLRRATFSSTVTAA